MEQAELAIYAAIGALGLAFVLWALTNWHVLRVGRSIKADIDAKRLATETFVSMQIGRIERSVADVSGKVSSIEMPVIPPEPPILAEMQEEVGALRRELSDALAQMGADLRELPRKVQILFAQGAAAEQQVFQGALRKAEDEMSGVMDLKAQVMAGDPEALKLAIMKKVSGLQVSEKLAAERPGAAMLLELGKIAAMQLFEGTGARPSGLRRPGRPSSERMDLKL